MFDRLTESGPRRPSARRASLALVSLVAHAAAVAATLQATDAPRIPEPRRDTMVIHPFPVDPPTPVGVHPSGGPAGPSGEPSEPGVPRPGPIEPIGGLATEGIDPGATAGDERLSDVLSVVTAGPGAGPGGPELRVRSEAIEPPRPLHSPEPTYPAALREARIEGTVELEFTVDSLGHVAPGSVVVVSTAMPALVAPAREALLASRFAPARLDGRPIAARARRAFVFRVTRLPG
jgi:TonB family protein